MGPYYLEVFSPAPGDNTAYTLQLDNDTAGDTIATARRLPDSTGAHEYVEGLNDTDDLTDIFQFHEDDRVQSSTFGMRLMADNSPNYQVDLILDANHNNVIDSGEVIASSQLIGGEAEIAPMKLQNQGFYYLRVTHIVPASENYTLRTFFDDAGSTIATARQFNTEGFYQVLHDQVGTQNIDTFLDPSDVYKIQFVNPGFRLYAEVDLEDGLSPSVASLKEELFKDTNNNGVLDASELLASASTSSSSGSAFLNHAVPPGVYFLRVTGGPSANYTLQLSGDKVPGLTASTPQFSNSLDIGQLDQQDREDDGLGAGDTSDTYKFSLANAASLLGTVEDSFSQEPQPLTGTLATDKNHNGVLDAGETLATFSLTSALSINLPAGTYFVTLSTTGHHFGTELLLTPDFAGNDALTARNLGTLGAFSSFKDGVGAFSPKDDDFYKFSLASADVFTAVWDLNSGHDPMATTTLTLFKDNGNGELTQLQQSTSTAQVFLLQRSLAAGNYQLKVSTTTSYYNYTLGLSVGDNDDSIGEAQVSPNRFEEFPVTKNFTLSSATDVDMLEFFAGVEPGRVIAIDLDSRNASNVDTFLRVFDSSGHQLASNDTGAAPGETASKFSYLTFKVPAEGAYFVGISSAGNNSYNPLTGGGDAGGSSFGAYSVTLSDIAAPANGSISGTLFRDSNGNGIKDSGEVGMGGQTVWIDLDNDKIVDSNEPKTTTDASGNYKLSGLAARTYKVRELPPAGWQQTTPLNGLGIPVALGAGQNVTGKNFGVRPITGTSSIAGTVFHDFDRDGVRDATDTGIAAWRVYIDTNNNGVLDSGEISVLTDSSGNYKISNLSAATYKVREQRQSGFVQTTPANNLGISVALASGQNATGRNFGVDN